MEPKLKRTKVYISIRMCEIEEVCKTLNNWLWDTQAVEIDGDLCRPTGKEVIVGHKHCKQPRGAKKERPGLDSQERHFVIDGTPRECAKDTGENGEDGADSGDDYARGEYVCGTLLPRHESGWTLVAHHERQCR
jgi:hypothetical protein